DLILLLAFSATVLIESPVQSRKLSPNVTVRTSRCSISVIATVCRISVWEYSTLDFRLPIALEAGLASRHQRTPASPQSVPKRGSVGSYVLSRRHNRNLDPTLPRFGTDCVTTKLSRWCTILSAAYDFVQDH